MKDSKQPKFKVGDKVICVIPTSNQPIKFGEIYTVKSLLVSGQYIELAEFEVEHTYRANRFELYIEKHKPNYREMSPTDLIKISIDGNEAEIPLGDLVNAKAILGKATGKFGGRLWNFIYESLGEGEVDDIPNHGMIISFAEEQKEALDNFFKPYYDKLDEKAKLSELIESKSKELNELKEKLLNI